MAIAGLTRSRSPSHGGSPLHNASHGSAISQASLSTPSSHDRPASRIVANLVLGFIAILGYLAAIILTLSPWVGDALERRFDNLVPTPAQVISCAPARAGMNRETVVLCRFRYDYRGQTHLAEAPGWRSRNPFLTSAGLARVVETQSAMTRRTAYVRDRDPEQARLADRRPLAMPPLWVWLLALLIGLGVAAFRFDPSGLPYRRADLAPDPETGHLEPINNNRRDRVRRRVLFQGVAALVAMAICLFGLSNSPTLIVGKAGMTALRPTPARLVDCQHQRHGGYRGNSQIDCAFEYQAGGQTLRGQAESLDFRLFPTRSRMDAAVAKIAERPAVTAYVDPRYPTYAWAAISTDTVVPFTWGLFSAELWFLVGLFGLGVVGSVVRWVRAAA